MVDTFSNTGYPGNSAADFTATIKWGDGQTTAGIVAGGSGANLTVAASHAYAKDGKYSATVTLSDDAPGTAKATATNAITVTEAPISARGGITVNGVEGNYFGTQAFASFADANSLALAGSDSASILWGDGTTSAGILVPVGGGTNLVEGSHRYAEQGQYTVTIKISDDHTVVKTVTSTAVIADAPLTVTGLTIHAKHGATFSGTVANMADGDPVNTTPGDYKGTINWGDGTSSSASFVFVSPGHWLIKGSHKYTRIGKFTLKISVQDSTSTLFSGSGIANVT